jgi:hypothetical protein
MIFYSLFVLLTVIMFDRLLRFGTQTVVLKHQFRLYALRDALRECAMSGKVDAKNWVFQYLDSSIAKTIRVMPGLSLWRVLVMMLVHRSGDESIRKCQEQLKGELEKSENEPLARIHLHYMGLVGFFLFERHSSLSTPVRGIFRAVKAGQFLRAQWRKAKEFLTEAPETSTLPEFVHAQRI